MYLDAPDISVITPSLNMLPYLQRCSASVADQEGVSVEHIIVDGASTDGTSDWLTTKGNLVSIVGRDSGMYEAVNRGLSDARGGILAYLNCDEQYLPGALRAVKSVFDADTDVHMVFGDSLIVGRDGTMIAYRKGYAPRWHYIQVSHLYNLSCSFLLSPSRVTI
ncbi:MAG: glycosyltransferase [Anaerolineae bacterium]|nr:glycosyltransferase [Anaerolineae bacterium]